MAKKLIFRNIFGKPTKVEGDDSGVTKVASLPTTGEKGKIYYDTTNEQYSVYDGSNYIPVGSLAIEEVTNLNNKTNRNVIYHYSNSNTGAEGYYIYNGSELVNINGSALAIKDCSSQQPEQEEDGLYWNFDLVEGKYHLLGSVGQAIESDSQEERVDCYVYLSFLPNTSVASQYIGRFTCLSTITLLLPSGIYIPDTLSDLTFEEGHTYEFNILYDTCLITDITHTENSGS